jgi:CBS domain-containing protein
MRGARSAMLQSARTTTSRAEFDTGRTAMNIARVLATKGRTVVTIQPEQSIRRALSLLSDHNIGALVVVDGGGVPIGIISERDIVREATRDEQIFSRAVDAIMTREVVLGVPEDELISVSHTMTERRIRHLPVVERGRLVGIVSIGDVVKAQRDQYQGEVETLQTQLLAES